MGCSNRLSNKAAGEVKAAGVLFHPPSHEPAVTGSFPVVGYVEDFDEPRTQLGKGRVLARLGRAGVMDGVFSILLEGEACAIRPTP
jgi:hypothetical protein